MGRNDLAELEARRALETAVERHAAALARAWDNRLPVLRAPLWLWAQWRLHQVMRAGARWDATL